MPILETVAVMTGLSVIKSVTNKAIAYFFIHKTLGAKQAQLPALHPGQEERHYLAQQTQREQAWLVLQKEALDIRKAEVSAEFRISSAEAQRAEYALQLSEQNLEVRRQELALMQERLRHEQAMSDTQRKALAVNLQLRTKEIELIEQGLAAKQEMGRQYLAVLRQQAAQAVELKQQELQAQWDDHKWAGLLSRHEMQQILNAHDQHHRLLVIVSPPLISRDAPTALIENLPLELPSELKAFLEEQYPANDPLCPVQFFGRFFEKPIFDTEVKKLETLLAPLPSAILYSNITDDKVFIHFSFSRGGEALAETLSWQWREEQMRLIEDGVAVETALRQVRHTIVAMHQFLAAFLTDLYYLSVNPLHEPRIYRLESETTNAWQAEIFTQIRTIQVDRQQRFQQEAEMLVAEQAYAEREGRNVDQVNQSQRESTRNPVVNLCTYHQEKEFPMTTTPLQNLRMIFDDRPEVLRMLDLHALDLEQLTSEQFLDAQTRQQLFPRVVNLYATGKTHAGKTTLARKILDPQHSVDLSQVLRSTGQTDCTSKLLFFAMRSNLCYFDLPGAGGNSETYENINRAALLIEQVDDEEEGMRLVRDFTVWNCTDFPITKTVQEDRITVAAWQSAENQRLMAPDVILYVVAPHTLFTRDDRKYLTALLKAKQQQNAANKIIFVLNFFEGVTKSQNVQDTVAQITSIYQKFYPGCTPPIVEVDCQHGTGIHKIVEWMCQLLPENLISNLGQVLQEQVKEIAYKERSRRYRQALIQIASRLATLRVDQQFGNSALLDEAYAAVCDYGLRAFYMDKIRLQAEQDLYTLAGTLADKAKISRTEAVTILVNDVVEKEVTEEVKEYQPRFEEVEVVEVRPRFYQKTEYQDRNSAGKAGTAIAEGLLHITAAPISVMQGIGKAIGLGKKTAYANQAVRKNFEKAYQIPVTVWKTAEEEVKRIEQQFRGMEESRRTVTKKVPTVVQRSQEVGKKAKVGGYAVVEDILAVGLGIEAADPAQDLCTVFATIVENGRRMVQCKLLQEQSLIDQYAEAATPQDGEAQICALLSSKWLV